MPYMYPSWIFIAGGVHFYIEVMAYLYPVLAYLYPGLVLL